MKKLLKSTGVFVILLFSPNLLFTQVTNALELGTLTDFEAYTGTGAATNYGTFIGDVGSDNGTISGFVPPQFSGTVHYNNSLTDRAKSDLVKLYIQLNDIPVTHPAYSAALGSGETIYPGVYSIPMAGTLAGTITLDGGGNPDAIFIIKCKGALSVGVNAEVILSNGTRSCNVFWIAQGAISVGANTTIKGTLFANLGAVSLGVGDYIEGRLFTLEGAITIGLGSTAISPPDASTIQINSRQCTSTNTNILGSVKGFALFTSLGAVPNTGTSGVIGGDIGTNGGGTIGGFALKSVHSGSEQTTNALTVQAKTDLDLAYTQLMAMTPNVMHLPIFGGVGVGETVGPGVYHIAAAGSLGGTITLDGGGDANAIFVFRFAGAFSIGAQSKIILANGTQSCNVYWLGGAGVATGAVTIGALSDMKGTFISHGGACNAGANCFIEGRLLSTAGAVTFNTSIIYPVYGTVLPIDLLSFTATNKGSHVKLNWVTASETNNNYFNVERSSDRINFTSISKIHGAGNSTQILSYSAVDDIPFKGWSYYRLKQTDYNGEISYSNLEAVKSNNDFIFDIYPNPFSGETTFYSTEELKDARLIIYNSHGQVVIQIKNISRQKVTLNCENLSSGLYYINLLQDGKIIVTDKLVITD
jgi:hypothetical protein